MGPEGQARIAASPRKVRGNGLAAIVEARYLAGAGVEAIEVEDEGVAAAAREVDATVKVRVQGACGDLDDDLDPPWARPLAPPARDVALGAHRALRVLRRAVLSPREPSP